MNEHEKRLLESLLAFKEERLSGGEAFSSECKEYEGFYLGDQWKGEEQGGAKPVFNLIKRICDYVISTLASKEFSLAYTSDGAPLHIRKNESFIRAIETLTRHVSYKYDKEALERLIFSLVRDAVIYGTGVLYTRWDTSVPASDGFFGDAVTEVIEPYRIFPADMCEPDVEKQSRFLIKGKSSVTALSGEALLHGREVRKKLLEANGGEEEAQFTLMLYRDEKTRSICFAKECAGILISYGDSGLSRYPIATFSPIPVRGSFFGRSYVKGIIPNQKYVNTSYALLMKHMQDTAFSKVIYDKSRIPEWTSEPGIAIGAHGGGNLSDCVSVVGCGKLEDGYLELTKEIAEKTKELYGATETALGNVEPTNTSAIMAVKEAAEGQLRGCVILLVAALESQAKIWADVVCTYYGDGRKVGVSGKEEEHIALSRLRTHLPSCKISVNDRSRFGSSVALDVLNKLLEQKAISPSEYIKRLPDGIIEDKDSLIKNAQDIEKNILHEQTA